MANKAFAVLSALEAYSARQPIATVRCVVVDSSTGPVPVDADSCVRIARPAITYGSTLSALRSAAQG